MAWHEEPQSPKETEEEEEASRSRYLPRTRDAEGRSLYELRGRHWHIWDQRIWDLCGFDTLVRSNLARVQRNEEQSRWCGCVVNGNVDDWQWCGLGVLWWATPILLVAAVVALCLAFLSVVPAQQRLAEPVPPPPPEWVVPPPYLVSNRCSWRADARALWPPVCQRSCGCDACRPGLDAVCQPYAAASRCCAGGTDNTTCCGERCTTCTRYDPVSVSTPCSCPSGPGAPDCVACVQASPTCAQTCTEPGFLRVTSICNCSCIATAATELCSTTCVDRHAIAVSFAADGLVLVSNRSSQAAGRVAAGLFNVSCDTQTLGQCWLGLLRTHPLVGAPALSSLSTSAQEAAAASGALGLVPNGTFVSGARPCWWWANATRTLASAPQAYANGSHLVSWNDLAPQAWLPALAGPPPPVSFVALVAAWVFGVAALLVLPPCLLAWFFVYCWGEEARTLRVPVAGIRAVRSLRGGSK